MEIAPANFHAYITNSKAILKNVGHLEISNANIGFLIPQIITFPKMYNLAHPQKLPTQLKIMP